MSISLIDMSHNSFCCKVCKSVSKSRLTANFRTLIVAVGIVTSNSAFSHNAALDQGAGLLATGGASQIEGTAGGGLVPMAVLAGYGTDDSNHGAGFFSRSHTDDYELTAFGVAWSWHNRVEISLARQELNIAPISNALGLSNDFLVQNIAGLKIRLAGDLVYDTLPQLSLGVQYKHNEDFLIPQAVNADREHDFDVYLVASKLFLAGLAGKNLLLNGVIRATRANQGGLIGFGGDKENKHSFVFEGSAGVFLNKHWLAGIEYKDKPDNLSFAKEDPWHDVFIAWFPDKQWSVIAAYVNLGDIAGLEDQTGWYLSMAGSY